MLRPRAPRLCSLLLCGCAAMLVPGCDDAAGVDGPLLAQPDKDGCVTAGAGAGFASVLLGPTGTLGVIDLTASATAADVDGVIGLSREPVTHFDHLATAVRFAPGGVLDARDGGAYRADTAIAFGLGRRYPIRTVADASSHTYSVYVQTSGDPTDVVRLARRFAFRPSQDHAARLGALSVIADGPTGELTVCRIVGTDGSDVAFSREGSYVVAPLPSGAALASDGISSTVMLDPAGQELGRVRRGGELAVDEAGNVYVALASNGQLAVYAYTTALAPRWDRIEAVAPEVTVRGAAADATGVSVALGTPDGMMSIRRYPATGGAGVQVASGGTRAALARDGFAIATTWNGGLGVTLYDRDGRFRWIRTFTVAASVEVMTLGLDGRVVLGGHFEGPIGFGGPVLQPANGEVDVDSYAVALARADGAHVFTARIPT
ncbi:MAG TPA: hypothetical protein VN253_09995, partial [Kofleriaceae bacterium]|nr:hypothetical protein [Kofleriaceae bacterium]